MPRLPKGAIVVYPTSTGEISNLKGNYITKILALQDAGKLTAGQCHSVDIRHDDWCDRLTGNHSGVCNCDPDIYLNGKKVAL